MPKCGPPQIHTQHLDPDPIIRAAAPPPRFAHDSSNSHYINSSKICTRQLKFALHQLPNFLPQQCCSRSVVETKKMVGKGANQTMKTNMIGWGKENWRKWRGRCGYFHSKEVGLFFLFFLYLSIIIWYFFISFLLKKEVSLHFRQLKIQCTWSKSENFSWRAIPACQHRSLILTDNAHQENFFFFLPFLPINISKTRSSFFCVKKGVLLIFLHINLNINNYCMFYDLRDMYFIIKL